jgi:hypothetical protein
LHYDCPGDLSSPRWRLAALPAVALYPASRARMLRTRALTFMLAAWLDWPRLSWLCPLRVVPRARGPCVVAAASWSSSRGRSPCWRRPQLWSMSWRLRPGRSGPGAALHVGIPARLTRARRAPSPPRIVTCSVHAVPVRPAAAPWTRTWSSPGHAGALLAGGAPSLVQASRAWMLMTLPRSPCRQPGPTGHGSPGSASSAPRRVHAGPVRPAAASWSSSNWCSPRWRRSQLWPGSWRDRGAPGPGAVTGRMRATRRAVGARREPVLPAGLPARIFSGFPQGPGSAATCRLHVALIASDSRRWLSSSLAFVASTVAVVRRGHSCVTFVLETLALHAGAWRRSQRWPFIQRLGPGCSGPGL